MTGRHFAPAARRGRRMLGTRVGAAVAASFVAAVLWNAASGGGASAAGTATTTTTTAAPPAATTTQLNGEGTWDVEAEMLGWQNDLYGANGAVNLNYLNEGGAAGRNDLLAGSIDYAISGVPYSNAELASYGKTAADIIAAPIMPSAVGFLLNPPVGGFYTEDSNGNRRPGYTGPIRLLPDNVTGQMFFYNLTNQQTPAADAQYEASGLTAYPYNEWDNPEIVKNWDSSLQYDPGNGDVLEPYRQTPEEIQQAEGNEDTYYLEAWTQQSAPDIWGLLQKEYDPGATASNPFSPAEQLQPGVNVSQVPGLDQVIGDVVGNDTGARTQNQGGTLAAVPPSSLQVATADQAANIARCQANHKQVCPSTPTPGQAIEWVDVPNANGDWVAPTPQAVDAALAATPANTATATSGATPLYAATNDVAGAYPLTYVDYLYAPSTGLSVAKTEALATTIRYLVTDGQMELTGNGDGQLTPTLVAQALAAANQVVQSNCPAAGGQVVLTSASEPDTPNLPGIKALGPVDHCEAPASTSTSTSSTSVKTTTTTTARKKTSATSTSTPSQTPTTATTPTSSPAGPSGGTTRGGDTTSPTASPTPVASGGTHHSTGTTLPRTSSTTTRPVSVADAASNLPFPVSTGNSAGLDKVAALAVGVALYLLLRRRPAAVLRKLIGG